MKVLVLTPEWPRLDNPQRGWHIYSHVRMLSDCEVLDGRVFAYRPGRDPRRWRALRRSFQRVVRHHPPDLLHGQWSYSYAIGGGLGVPMLVQFNGSDGNGWPQAAPLVNPLNAAWGRWVARRASGVLFPNARMQQRFPTGRPHWVAPPGVDEDFFDLRDPAGCRRRLGLDPQRPVVLFAGQRHRPVKRYPLARRLIERLRAQPGSDVQELLAEGVPQRDMPDYYGAADVLLLVSSAEGSPNVVREALMCGCAVVATPVGDLPEYLESFPGCRLLDDPCADPDAAVRCLRGSLQEAATARHERRQRALARFGKRRYQRTLYEAYLATRQAFRQR